MFNFEIDWQFLSDVLTMLMFVEIDDTLPMGANAKANNKSRSSPLGTFLQMSKCKVNRKLLDQLIKLEITLQDFKGLILDVPDAINE